METPTVQAPAPAAPAPASQPSGNSFSANNVIVTLFTGIITGVAIGLGLIISQKLTKKSVIIETKSDSSSANGNPNMMYPPRVARPPMHMPMRNPYGMPMNQYGGYAQAEGSQQSFDIQSWLESNRANGLENLKNVQD